MSAPWPYSITMVAEIEKPTPEATADDVQVASEESFPASDAPAGPPVIGARVAKASPQRRTKRVLPRGMAIDDHERRLKTRLDVRVADVHPLPGVTIASKLHVPP